MARVSPVTVAVVATATVAAAGTAVYLLTRGRCAQACRAPQGPQANPAPTPPKTRAPAPDDYEARWEERREAVLAACRADPQVQTWAQAVACALRQAYPEVSSWGTPQAWTPWMQRAAAMVEDDIASAASRDGGSPRAWEVVLWLRADTELQQCSAQIPALAARCVAHRLYPTRDWQQIPEAWQHEMLAVLTQIARAA